MSDFIKRFRAKYPQYSGVDDAKLASALSAKYNAESGNTLSQGDFYKQIGYTPIAKGPTFSMDQPEVVNADGSPQIGNPDMQLAPDLSYKQDLLPKPELGLLADQDKIGSNVQTDPMANMPEISNTNGPADLPEGFVQGPAYTPPQQPKEQLGIFGKAQNIGAKIGERAATLSSKFLDAAGEFNKLSMGSTPQELAYMEKMSGASDKLKQVDLGYEEQKLWEDIKTSFSEGGPLSGSAYADVLEYGVEQGLGSIPDMAAVMLSMPSYIAARSSEMGDTRAKNDGREKADLKDMLVAAPFAAASALLEKIGVKGMGKAAMETMGKEMLKAGVKATASRVAKAAGKGVVAEGVPEFFQEGVIEYVGENFGTDSAMSFKDALDRGAGAFVAGGVFGGVASGSGKLITESKAPSKSDIAEGVTELPSPEKQALEAMKPERTIKEDKKDVQTEYKKAYDNVWRKGEGVRSEANINKRVYGITEERAQELGEGLQPEDAQEAARYALMNDTSADLNTALNSFDKVDLKAIAKKIAEDTGSNLNVTEKGLSLLSRGKEISKAIKSFDSLFLTEKRMEEIDNGAKIKTASEESLYNAANDYKADLETAVRQNDKAEYDKLVSKMESEYSNVFKDGERDVKPEAIEEAEAIYPVEKSPEIVEAKPVKPDIKVEETKLSTKEVKDEINAIGDKAKLLRDNDLEGKYTPPELIPSEMDYLSDAEKQRLHDLKIMLPSQAQEAADAKARIKKRIAKRKEETPERSAPKEIQDLKNTIAEGRTILKGKLETNKRKAIQKQVAKDIIKLKKFEAALKDGKKAFEAVVFSEKKNKTSKSVDAGKDSLLIAIKKLGGIQRNNKKGITVEDVGAGDSKYMRFIFTNKGIGIDNMVVSLIEHGYLAKHDGVNKLIEKIRKESAGDKQMSQLYDYEKEYNQDYSDIDEQINKIKSKASKAKTRKQINNIISDIEKLPVDNDYIEELTAMVIDLEKGFGIEKFNETLKSSVLSSKAPKKTDVKSISKLLSDNGIKNSIRESGDIITIDKIIVPEEQRGAGIGTEAMSELISYANKNSKTIALSPSVDFGGKSLTAINNFYKKLGFVPNKGRNKNFQTSESMIKDPVNTNKKEELAKIKDDSDFKNVVRKDSMPNWVAPYDENNLPQRPESGMIKIGNREVKLNEIEKPVRREGIKAQIQGITGSRIYSGKQGRNNLGIYKGKNAAIRLKNYGDVQTLSHEAAHFLDRYQSAAFANLYNKSSEVKSLSYTSDLGLTGVEGFAEYVRLWLTKYDEALSKAPKFTKSFETLLSHDKALNKKMKKLQTDMHKYFNQGDLSMAYGATSGNKYTASENRAINSSRMGTSLIRQKYIDNIHAAKVITRETTGFGPAETNAYKQLQLLNGVDGIVSYSYDNGALTIDKDGTIDVTGPSLKDVWDRSVNAGPQRIKDQEVYFASRRATELKSQGRENRFSDGMIRAGNSLVSKYPYFQKAFENHQEYNKNMQKFFVDTGYITQEASDSMQKDNESWVPFNRVLEGVAQAYTGVSAGFSRLRGGEQNIKPIYDNILKINSRHIYAALKARAMRNLYKSALNSTEGSKFLDKIAPDALPTKVDLTDMISKVSKVMSDLGMSVSEGKLTEGGKDLTNKEISENNKAITEYFKDNSEELMFWTFGHKPSTVETEIDSFIDHDGKRVWVEFNKENELLPDMIANLDGVWLDEGALKIVMKVAFSIKNNLTLAVTSMPQFFVGNIVRDQQQAFVKSGGKYKPFYDMPKGFTEVFKNYLGKSAMYREMILQGGPGGGRLRQVLSESYGLSSGKEYKKTRPYYHPAEWAHNTFEVFLSVSEAFEMATRVSYYSKLRKEGVSAQEAAWQARELTTDFAKHGSYAPFVLAQRTIPFNNAYFQSADNDIMNIIEEEGEAGLMNALKFTPLRAKVYAAGMSMIATTVAIAMLGDDDSKEKREALTPDQKARFFNIFIDGEHYTIPKAHGLWAVFSQIAESSMDALYSGENSDAVETMLYSFSYNFGTDIMPGALKPWYEVATNKDFKGAPIVSPAVSGASPHEQYTNRTGLAYVNAASYLSKKIGVEVSPQKAEHIIKGHAGYAEQIFKEATNRMIWDNEKWGERPYPITASKLVLKNFKPSYERSKYVEKYYDLKEEASKASNDLRLAIKRYRRNGKKDIEEKSKNKLAQINGAMTSINQALGSMNTEVNDIWYNKKYSRKSKEYKIDKIYKDKTDIIKENYIEIKKYIKESK